MVWAFATIPSICSADVYGTLASYWGEHGIGCQDYNTDEAMVPVLEEVPDKSAAWQ